MYEKCTRSSNSSKGLYNLSKTKKSLQNRYEVMFSLWLVNKLSNVELRRAKIVNLLRYTEKLTGDHAFVLNPFFTVRFVLKQTNTKKYIKNIAAQYRTATQKLLHSTYTNKNTQVTQTNKLYVQLEKSGSHLAVGYNVINIINNGFMSR